MAKQSPQVNPEQQRLSRRQERAHRILDAAAALILRWGYNKTTVDDIAREAGVAKGTIYLHWKMKEDLFGALIQRENWFNFLPYPNECPGLESPEKLFTRNKTPGGFPCRVLCCNSFSTSG